VTNFWNVKYKLFIVIIMSALTQNNVIALSFPLSIIASELEMKHTSQSLATSDVMPARFGPIQFSSR